MRNLGDYPQCFVGVVSGVTSPLASSPHAEAHDEENDDYDDECQEDEGGQDYASYVARA